LFEYDQSSSIEASSSTVWTHIQGNLHELAYRLPESSEGARAWLIKPPQSGPSPFVVALHGGGQDRDAYLAEARILADIGIASLLIDLPAARAFPNFSCPDEELDRFAKTVITVRRGVDYLSLRSDIDQTRGAIVGGNACSSTRPQLYQNGRAIASRLLSLTKRRGAASMQPRSIPSISSALFKARQALCRDRYETRCADPPDIFANQDTTKNLRFRAEAAPTLGIDPFVESNGERVGCRPALATTGVSL
jgi:hypothetical protein